MNGAVSNMSCFEVLEWMSTRDARETGQEAVKTPTTREKTRLGGVMMQWGRSPTYVSFLSGLGSLLLLACDRLLASILLLSRSLGGSRSLGSGGLLLSSGLRRHFDDGCG